MKQMKYKLLYIVVLCLLVTGCGLRPADTGEDLSSAQNGDETIDADEANAIETPVVDTMEAVSEDPILSSDEQDVQTAVLTEEPEKDAAEATETEDSEDTPSRSILPALPNFSDYLNQSMIREILRDYRQETSAMLLDEAAWQYDEEHNVYYQLLVPYCSYPSAGSIEVLSIFVPGAYMTEVEGDGGETVLRVNPNGEAGSYTAKNAPFFFPVETDGYEKQEALGTYDPSVVSPYTDAGYICVSAGLRGKSNGVDPKTAMSYAGGAPFGVTDLKAAIRFCRLNDSTLPGDTNRVFTAGRHEGASLCAVAAASGDSRLYLSYLISIGAAMYDEEGAFISDTVYGVDVTSPAAAPDEADAAYEWYAGQYLEDIDRTGEVWTAAFSKDLAGQYASYIYSLGLTGEDGEPLTLSESSKGIFTEGSYEDYLLDAAGRAMTDLLAAEEDPGSYAEALNADEEWVLYDEERGKAEITSLEALIRHREANKRPCPAYDRLDLSAPENELFGTGRADTRHFSTVIYNMINERASTYSGMEGWNRTLSDELADDMACADENGTDLRTRVLMYSPLYFLSPAYDAYGSAGVAPVWRLSSAVADEDCVLPSDINLYLALCADEDVPEPVYKLNWFEKDNAGRAEDIVSWIDSVLLAGEP